MKKKLWLTGSGVRNQKSLVASERLAPTAQCLDNAGIVRTPSRAARIAAVLSSFAIVSNEQLLALLLWSKKLFVILPVRDGIGCRAHNNGFARNCTESLDEIACQKERNTKWTFLVSCE